MNKHEVKAILDWELPKSILALRSFLGLASYCRKFINNFTKIAPSLINFFKKSAGTYEWDGVSQPHFGQSGRMQLPFPKVETWSPPGFPKTQKVI